MHVANLAHHIWISLLLSSLLLSCGTPQRGNTSADTNPTDTTTTTISSSAEAILLSAFFGLDNGLPLPSNLRLCPGAGGADGMPVIFSHEIDQASMQAGDFQVIRQSGAVGQITCVTLAPAIDPGELRTALLVGEFGSSDDPPVAVEIHGNLLSIDQRLNFKGATVAVTPLAPGPTMVFAEMIPIDQADLGNNRQASWGQGDTCPSGTTQVVRVVWSGGVTRLDDQDVGETERLRYQISLQAEDGSMQQVVPFALADLGDGDNNHELCLNIAGIPQQINFPAGLLVDPNDDLNPDTTVTLSR